MVKTCPSSDARRWENATRLMLTGLSISSMALTPVIMLRRMTTPISPIANSDPDSIRYASVLGAASSTHRLLDFLLHLDPVEDELLRRLFLARRQLALADHDRADHRHEQEERRDFERHEIVAIQRHPHGLGIRIRPVHAAIDVLAGSLARLRPDPFADLRQPRLVRPLIVIDAG